jgi:hypothetical protein
MPFMELFPGCGQISIRTQIETVLEETELPVTRIFVPGRRTYFILDRLAQELAQGFFLPGRDILAFFRSALGRERVMF